MLFTLKALRTNAGYTASEVSDIVGIHVQTLLKYEKDSSKIPMHLLKKLEKIYDTPLDYIFLGEEFELNRTIQQKQEV